MSIVHQKLAGLKGLRVWLFEQDAFYAKLLGSSLVGILAISALAVTFLMIAIRDHQYDQLRSRTLQILQVANKLENEIANLETSQRGYLLTGDDAYLTAFQRRVHLTSGRMAELQSAVATHDPSEAARVAKVQANITRWLTTVAEPEVKRRRTAKELIPNAGGQAIIDEARTALNTLQSEEQALLNAKTKTQSWANQSFQVLVFAPKLSSVVSDMEKAEWGYLLSGDKTYLDLYKSASGDFYAYHGHLSVLLADRPDASAQLSQIKQAVEQWQNHAALNEITAKQQGHDLTPVIAQGQGRQLLRQIHSLIDHFEQNEDQTYQTSNLRVEIERIIKAAGSGLLCVLAIGFLIASSWYSFLAYRRHLRNIASAQAQTMAIIETTLDGVLTLDSQGLVHSMNPAAEKMFGHAAQVMIGRSISQLIPQRLFIQDMAKLGRGTLTAMGQRQNYYPFPIEISLSEMNVEGQRRYVALIRDVTERRRSEETLRNIGIGVSNSTGEEFVRSLVKQLSKALETDFAFIVEVVRKGSESTTQLSLAEGGNIRSKQNYDLSDTACEEVMKKGYRAFENSVRDKFPHDEMLKELGADSFVAMPLVDHRGRTVGLMGVIDRKPMENIQIAESTLQIFAGRAAAEIERKRFEEDLAAEKERLAVTLRSIGDGFITVDGEGRILMLNQVAEKLTGWSHENAAGRPLDEVFILINERTRKPFHSAIQRIVETGSVVGGATCALVVSRDGTERLVENTASPIRDRTNRRVGAVLVFRDITERSRAEEERRKAEKLESLGIAAGGIAHDFNNILTAIIGNLSLSLLTSSGDEELVERLTTAKKAALRAQELAQQLLTFAKGGAPIKKTASIAQFIQETAQAAIKEPSLRSEFRVAPDLWPVEIDSGQIAQVINNLVVNAEQAMPAGGTVSITGENFHLTAEDPKLASLQPGRYVRIVVHDEGIGIPAEYLKKIFDPYFTTKPKGSGLGLATAYSIIKSHEGQITVESRPGEGSTFTIYLPGSEKEVPAEKAAAAKAPFDGGKILVLDDEEAICSLVTHALTPLGYAVTESHDAPTAIRLYQEALAEGRRYDAVIMDLTIPGGMGGQEAVKKIRALDPSVKAIVSSGYAMDPVMSRYQEYGFCGCIAKPYELDDLGALVHEVLTTTDDEQTVVYHEFLQTQLA